MNLAFTIFTYFPFGGLQLDFRRTLAEALRRGHAVTVLYGRWEGEFIPGADYRQLKTRAFTNWGRARAFERKAGKFLQNHFFDRVVGFNRMNGLDVYFAADNCFAQRSKKKHFLLRLFAPRYRVFERMEEAVFAADAKTRVLYLTEAQKADCRALYGTANERFRLLPPGIAPEFVLKAPDERAAVRQRMRAALNIPADAVLLVQVCSAFRTKGVDRVIAALTKLPEERLRHLVYVVAGSGSPGKYRRQAARLGLADKVIFAGARRDVPELLTAADLMVHPARDEATGTALAEAAACGLPTVCSGNCGYAALTAAAGGIVLTEPFTIKELTAVLTGILSSPEHLTELKRQALDYAGTVDFHHRAEKFVDYLEETVRNG